MSDTTILLPGVMPEAPEPEDRRDDNGDDARRWLALTVLIVVLAVLALLLMRSCVPASVKAADIGGGKQIGVVEPLPEDEFSVSIWCRPGVNPKTVLKRHGLSSDSMVRFSNGATVVTCTGKDPDAIVARLQKDEDLYDAGYVYTEDGESWGVWDSNDK